MDEFCGALSVLLLFFLVGERSSFSMAGTVLNSGRSSFSGLFIAVFSSRDSSSISLPLSCCVEMLLILFNKPENISVFSHKDVRLVRKFPVLLPLSWLSLVM
jgi:hypothetical protein